MSYDGVVTCAMVQELKNELTLGKIEKIYQPQPDQLLLSVHTARGRRKLFISASGNHSAVYLTENTPENPAHPPLFCMVLRKHLGAARIKSISHSCDRIIEIDLETVDELGFNVNKRLTCEIMGKHSNVLLIDLGTGKIIESIKHVGIDVNRARQILPGKLYEYPPGQEKKPFTEITEEDIKELMVNQLQPERNLLAGIQGVSPPLAQSIASAPSPYEFLEEMRTAALNRSGDASDMGTPRVYLKDGKPADFHIVPLTAYENDDSYESVAFATLSQAAEYFFVNRESSNTVKQRAGDLSRVIKTHLDKLRLKVQRLNEDLAKAADSDKYRLYGELLNANLHLVKQGDKKAVVTSYYDGSQVEIPLDPRYTPARNAQNYFKKYSKSRTALKEKQIQLDETQAEIEYLDSVYAFTERAGTVEEIDLLRAELTEGGYIRYRKSRAEKNGRGGKGGKSRAAKPKPHEYTLPSGKKVLVGRNNKENDFLTFKRASSNDIWLHTKDIPGSHVILLTEGEAPAEEDLRWAARIAAHHSKAAGSANVPVDYTKVRYVKKPNGAKPGYVIFTHNRTLYEDPAVPD